MKTRIAATIATMIFAMVSSASFAGIDPYYRDYDRYYDNEYYSVNCDIRIVDKPSIRYEYIMGGSENTMYIKAANMSPMRYRGRITIYAMSEWEMIEVGSRDVNIRANSIKNISVHFTTDFCRYDEYVIVPSFTTGDGEIIFYNPYEWYDNVIMDINWASRPTYVYVNRPAPMPPRMPIPRNPERPAPMVNPNSFNNNAPMYNNEADVSRRPSNTAGSMSSRDENNNGNNNNNNNGATVVPHNNNGNASSSSGRTNSTSSSSSSRANSNTGSSSTTRTNNESNGNSSSSTTRSSNSGSRTNSSSTTGRSTKRNDSSVNSGSSTTRSNNTGSNARTSTSSSNRRN